MKVCITILLGLCVVAASGKCKPNENEICNKDESCFCRTCISCSEGRGPSHQCGGRYLNGTVFRCLPCIADVSYSEESSIATCQPCPLCGGRETLQKCTPNRETICGTNCKKGFIMNNAVDDCLPDRSFTTPLPPNTAIFSRPFSSTAFQPTNKSKKVTSKPSHLNTSGRDGNPNNEDQDDHSKDNKIIILTVIGVAVMLSVGYLLNKMRVACFHRKKGRNQDDEEIGLTECKEPSSARSSQEIVPWSEDLYLRDINEDLRKAITTLISDKSTAVSGWRAIGEDRQFQGLITPIHFKAIDQAGNKADTNQGEHLLKQIETVRPKFTLTQFVEILKSLHRIDVVETITTYYSNKKELNSAVQIEP